MKDIELLEKLVDEYDEIANIERELPLYDRYAIGDKLKMVLDNHKKQYAELQNEALNRMKRHMPLKRPETRFKRFYFMKVWTIMQYIKNALRTLQGQIGGTQNKNSDIERVAYHKSKLNSKWVSGGYVLEWLNNPIVIRKWDVHHNFENRPRYRGTVFVAPDRIIDIYYIEYGGTYGYITLPWNTDKDFGEDGHPHPADHYTEIDREQMGAFLREASNEDFYELSHDVTTD